MSQVKAEKRSKARLARKLAAYSAAAGAAAFVAGKAQAAIVHVDPADIVIAAPTTAPDPGKTFIDIDGDTVADFSFNPRNIGGKETTLWSTENGTHGIRNYYYSFVKLAPAYFPGVLVSQSSPVPGTGVNWTTPSGMQGDNWGAGTWGGGTGGYVSMYYIGWANYNGVFGNNGTRTSAISLYGDTSTGGPYFLPFVLNMTGGLAPTGVERYGWIRYTLLGRGDGAWGGTMIIHDWAYEDSGAGILTGDTGEAGPPPVPEPATLGFLALGAVGLAALRRKA